MFTKDQVVEMLKQAGVVPLDTDARVLNFMQGDMMYFVELVVTKVKEQSR